jgi:PKD repeat protein
VIFNIACTKVTTGSTPFTWFDNGISCHWYNGNYALLNDSPTATYYVNGSVTFSGALMADFSANNTTPPKNTSVQFTDLCTGNPTSWNWSFDRTSILYLNGTTHTSQNPLVQFTDGGLYTVTLVASNAGNSDTKVKTAYICAGSSGLWNGTASSSWSVAANWDNLTIPGSSTDIVIPGSCTNWPVFDGNLTIGVDCRSLILSDPSSHIIINGNLVLH